MGFQAMEDLWLFKREREMLAEESEDDRQEREGVDFGSHGQGYSLEGGNTASFRTVRR